MSSSKKSRDAKFQLHIWSRLLEGRIALQKAVVASRECQSKPCDDEAIKSISKLLSSLVLLRDSYRCKSQFCSPKDSESQSIIDDDLLDAKHSNLSETRNAIIDKWYEKTKIGTIPKKGYTALELPTLQVIQNSLKDKDRLLRRTQIDRTSHQDDAVDPENFNDDDFYHHLLKEVINKEDNRKWVELQRLKYKNKRKADTKATKGRKIKKDLIPKLVNFMAPTRRPDALDERARHELVKSLFGGTIRGQTVDQ